jgi:hypothetical protein
VAALLAASQEGLSSMELVTVHIFYFILFMVHVTTLALVAP